jgi:hypothetical protein
MALMTWGLVLLVLLFVVVLVVAKLASSGGHPPNGAVPPVTEAPPSLSSALASVPLQGQDVPGAAGMSAVTPPVMLSGVPPLESGGLPLVFYTGAEFCPYCAAERWALAVALERFGTLSKLAVTSSSSQEVFGGTPSLSFRGASYSSRFVAFEAVEQYADRPASGSTTGFAATASLRPVEEAIVRRFDAPPYVSAVEAGALPFVDIGGKAVMVGSGFSPAVLGGSSVGSVAADLHDPASNVYSAVVGEANLLTAAICEATGGKPGSVCAQPVIDLAAAVLGSPRANLGRASK